MKKIISIGLILLLTSCIQAKVIHHNEDMAAQTAKKFAQTVLINKDFSIGYSFISENLRKTLSTDKFIEIIKKLHPKEYPTIIKTTAFEPIPGQPGMNIFIEGQKNDENFYYRLLMEGTNDIGYKVAGIWRGNGPYPASKLRKKFDS